VTSTSKWVSRPTATRRASIKRPKEWGMREGGMTSLDFNTSNSRERSHAAKESHNWAPRAGPQVSS